MSAENTATLDYAERRLATQTQEAVVGTLRLEDRLHNLLHANNQVVDLLFRRFR